MTGEFWWNSCILGTSDGFKDLPHRAAHDFYKTVLYCWTCSRPVFMHGICATER